MQNTHDYQTNILLLGEGKTGKTSFFNRIQGLDFPEKYSPTTGRGVFVHNLIHKGINLKMTVWDTGGSIRYKMNVTNTDFHDTYGILFFYAINNESSFNFLKTHWLKLAKINGEEHIQKVLIGNKKDMEQDREISEEQALELAKKKCMRFLEISSKEDDQKKCLSIIEDLGKQIINGLTKGEIKFRKRTETFKLPVIRKSQPQ